MLEVQYIAHVVHIVRESTFSARCDQYTDVSQNWCVTTITNVRTVQHATKIFLIIHSRAPVRLIVRESTANIVS